MRSQKGSRVFGFETVDEPHSIRSTTEKIESASLIPSRCLYCDVPLHPGYSLIPVDRKRKAKVPGLECPKCKTLFVKDPKPVFRCIISCSYARFFTLNGQSFEPYFDQKKQAETRKKREAQGQKTLETRQKAISEKNRLKEKMLSAVDGGILLATLKTNDTLIDCIISERISAPFDNDARVFHYSSVVAREILTAVFHSPRAIRIDEKEYRIEQAYPCDENGNVRRLFDTLIPSSLELKRGGGFYSASSGKKEELVDLLLFSPFTQRYELTRATYSRQTEKCYLDVSRFRLFVQSYGKPDVPLFFDSPYNDSGRLSFEQLRDESILHVYGYSVSLAEGITVEERRALLEEIVDLELLSVSRIVSLLEFFVRTHPQDKYIHSREEWKRDQAYISNYKVNPKRFLVLASGKK